MPLGHVLPQSLCDSSLEEGANGRLEFYPVIKHINANFAKDNGTKTVAFLREEGGPR